MRVIHSTDEYPPVTTGGLGTYIEDLVAFHERSGDAVTWTGFSNRTCVREAYQRSAIVLMPSRLEPCSIATWTIGVPLAFVSAFILHYPVWAVYALLSTEEIVRLAIAYFRVRSGKWIHTLAYAENAAEQ